MRLKFSILTQDSTRQNYTLSLKIYTSDRQTIKSIGETIEIYSLKQLDRPIYVLTDLVSFKLMAMSNVVWLIFDDWIKGHKTISDSFVSR